uniref:Putative ovule protein n=1 Tax=Solanum chacoense TaxID=4108 RepID=A0A0V0HNI4_SOLCH
MILLENTSRVHDPWGTREVHIPTWTISTCLCGRSQRTIIKSNNFARTISTCPTYTQSHVNACVQYNINEKG